MSTTTYDALVVGAGIIGAACAFRLAAEGLKVGVIEAADAPATGSTAKSAAGVRVQFSTPSNVRLSWESIQEYANFEELYGVTADYQPIGYLLIVPDHDWERHLAAVEVQRAVGAPVEVLTPAAAQQHVPFDVTGVHSATFGPRDGVVDPHGVTMAYLKLARERGAKLHLSTELLGARREGGAWRVSTSGGQFEAPLVVNAAGPWGRVVGERAGLEVPVDPYRRMIFVSGPLAEPHAYPLTVDLATGFYLRSEGQRVLMGMSNPAEPPGFDDSIDWGWLDATLGAGLARFPWLEEVSLDRRACWSGYYEITPDHGPIIGRYPSAEGWLNACGFSGHGVQQAPMVGRVIAEEATTGRASSIDIDEFRIERFLTTAARTEQHII